MRRAVLLCLLLTLSGSCATIASLGERYPTRMHVQQRTQCDCAVAGLAMLTRTLYDVAVTYVDMSHVQSQCGLTALEVVSIAAKMGYPIGLMRSGFDPGTHVGMLVIKWPWNQYHMVYVANGTVYDPRLAWPTPWPVFRTTETFTVELFLYEVGRDDPK